MSNQDKTTPKVGTILTGNEPKDAIHFAVACVKAACDLAPGEHVKYNKDNNTIDKAILLDTVGIVDPFIKEIVKKDSYCYLFLYPQTITSLRHNWEHPAFNNTELIAYYNNVELSESWLRMYVARFEGDYDKVINAIKEKGSACFSRDLDYEDFENKDSEFWKHVEIVIGEKLDEEHKKNVGFRCAC